MNHQLTNTTDHSVRIIISPIASILLAQKWLNHTCPESVKILRRRNKVAIHEKTVHSNARNLASSKVFFRCYCCCCVVVLPPAHVTVNRSFYDKPPPLLQLLCLLLMPHTLYDNFQIMNCTFNPNMLQCKSVLSFFFPSLEYLGCWWCFAWVLR